MSLRSRIALLRRRHANQCPYRAAVTAVPLHPVPTAAMNYGNVLKIAVFLFEKRVSVAFSYNNGLPYYIDNSLIRADGRIKSLL